VHTPRFITLLLASLLALQAFAAPRTQNVVFVTLDGVRTQDVFGGLDEIIAAHAALQPYSDIDVIRPRFSGATSEARREALMPVLWKELVPRGVMFGNRDRGSVMRVENPHCFSAPGYTEMLTGAPRADVTSNDIRRYPYPTALERVALQLQLPPGSVAQIGSWDGFATAAASRDGLILTTGGFDGLPARLSTPEIDTLVALRKDVLGLWEEGSEDVLTFRIAQNYLSTREPRLLWLGLGNSDDWAHADRYDRYLVYLNRIDRLIGELWSMLQSQEHYRDKTTLVITTDHGRGIEGKDWAEHDCSIKGTEFVWALVVGPDTPATGEANNTAELHLGQIAATLLQYFRIPASTLGPDARPALPGTLVDAPAP
jgi:hypothetical protein